MGRVALEDKEVKQADLLSSSLKMQLPKVAKPRTTNDPEAAEVWPMTLQEAIRIGLDNSEIVRVIAFGAQGIPIGGFEPTPLNTGASAGVASSLGSGTLQSVYDPAILETQIATALSTFDTAFTTSVLWGNNVQPFNNGVQGGSLSLTGHQVPDRLGERLGHVPDGPVEADGNRCDCWVSSTTSTGRTRTARSWSGRRRTRPMSSSR